MSFSRPDFSGRRVSAHGTPGAPRITSGAPEAVPPSRLELAHVLRGGGTLLLRYRNEPPA